MLPHYIVDGYNVIHAIPTLKKLLGARRISSARAAGISGFPFDLQKEIPVHDRIRRSQAA